MSTQFSPQFSPCYIQTFHFLVIYFCGYGCERVQVCPFYHCNEIPIAQNLNDEKNESSIIVSNLNVIAYSISKADAMRGKIEIDFAKNTP